MTTTQEPNPSVRQAVEQERAAYAWDQIDKIKQQHNTPLEQKYRSRVRGFGAMIQANGLGPAIAFLYAKGKADGKADGKENLEKKTNSLLLQHITDWLVKRNLTSGDIANQPMQWIGAVSQAEYRRTRIEALAIVLWLQRFAEGALEGPPTTDSSEGPK